MAKTRKEKENIVSKLSEELELAKSAVVFNYKGLSVSETEKLRAELRKNEVAFSIVKNSLLKIALDNKKIEIDQALLDQPLAVAFGMIDEVSAAKGVNTFAKEHEAIEILGGIYQNGYISKEKVLVLANLPSKEELYAKVVGCLAAPMSGMVNVLCGNLRGLVNVLLQYRDQRSTNN